jgi:mannose-6-phosphate isomerase-like protein (cupin superfamily)
LWAVGTGLSWSNAMNAFEYGEVSQEQRESGKPYLQFINEGTMSLGLYALAAGSTDTQSPHDEDEIYYVVAGRGSIVVAGERQPVQPGSIVFVAKEVEHRFVDIEEDLSILVFFAPEHRPQ